MITLCAERQRFCFGAFRVSYVSGARRVLYQQERTQVRHLLLGLMVALLARSDSPPQAKTPKESAKKGSPNGSGQAVKPITGCLDQQGEGYVLRELSTAGTVSALKGEMFSDDNFARYVGHKVTVHGRVQKEGERSVLHVTKVEDGGAGCSSQ